MSHPTIMHDEPERHSPMNAALELCETATEAGARRIQSAFSAAMNFAYSIKLGLTHQSAKTIIAAMLDATSVHADDSASSRCENVLASQTSTAMISAVSILGMDAKIPTDRIVVVIDVIRAFTTAAVAFERGVTEIACAPSVEVGRALRRLHTDSLLVGETNGLKPADFDFGNSPFEMSTAQLDGRRLIQATSNGTLGLARCPNPAALLAVSARNVGATARWIASNHTDIPYTLLCTGLTTEDWACARYLADLLDGSAPRRADLVTGIMDGAAEHAHGYAQLLASQRVDLSRDLSFCCDVDRSEFAMVGEASNDHVVLTKVPC